MKPTYTEEALTTARAIIAHNRAHYDNSNGILKRVPGLRKSVEELNDEIQKMYPTVAFEKETRVVTGTYLFMISVA